MKSLKTKQFSIIDDKNNSRMEFLVEDNDSKILLKNHDGDTRIKILVLNGEPNIYMFDSINDHPRIQLNVSKNMPFLNLFDGNFNIRASINIKGEEANISIFDINGVLIEHFPIPVHEKCC